MIKIKEIKYLLITFLVTINNSFFYGQDDYIVNHSRFMQKTNPSYFGFNSLNKVGVLYNQMKLNEFDKMDNKYVFGAISFDNLDVLILIPSQFFILSFKNSVSVLSTTSNSKFLFPFSKSIPWLCIDPIIKIFFIRKSLYFIY